MVSKITLMFDIVLLISLCGSCRVTPPAEVKDFSESMLEVECTQNTQMVPQYEVFEITFRHENGYIDPFFDTAIDVFFTSPSKKQIRVGGFHYGSSSAARIHTHIIQTDRGQRQQVVYDFDKLDLWKARFAPRELGKWKYKFVFKNAKGQEATGEGTFTCVNPLRGKSEASNGVKGRKPNPGFVRRHPISYWSSGLLG